MRLSLLAVGLAALSLFAAPRLLQSRRLHKAEEALRVRKAESAEAWLAAAVRAEPESGEVHFLLARLARRRGQLDVVHEELRRAYEFGIPQDRILREQWLALAQAGQMREAEPHLTELLLSAGDETPDVCEAYVNGYFRNLQFAPAFKILDAWEEDYPDDAQPHLFRGVYFQQEQRWSEAADAYAEALARDESRIDIRIRLAYVLSEAHEFDEALEQYQACLESHPEDVRVLEGLAECQYNRGEIEAALARFEEVLRIDPRNYDARFGLARIDSGSGAHERACSVLEKLVDEDPNRTDVLYAYAISLRLCGREDAEEIFTEVERREALVTRVDSLRRRAMQQPQDVELRYELGAALLELGQDESGERWLLSVLDANPNHPGARALLAEHFASTGRGELAARYRDDADSAE